MSHTKNIKHINHTKNINHISNMKNIEEFVNFNIKIEKQDNGKFGYFPFHAFVEKKDGTFDVIVIAGVNSVKDCYKIMLNYIENKSKRIYMAIDYPAQKVFMEFIKLNIDSTKSFYTDKEGNIYNQFYRKLKCSLINGSLFLSYIENDKNNTFRFEPIARLIYKTSFPDESLAGYNIYKIDSSIENPYQISNLKKVHRSLMPIQNKLPELHKNSKIPLNKRFYQKLSKEDLNRLIMLVKDGSFKTKFVAQQFNVKEKLISKYKNELKKMKIKK